MEDRVKKALELADFGLNYNVDYIYLLEEIKAVLEGNKSEISTDDLIDD